MNIYAGTLFVATDVHRKYTGSEETKWG